MLLKKYISQILFSLLLLFCSIYDAYGQKYNYSGKIKGGTSHGIVGAVEGDFSVSPMGQSSYTIPINSPNGTGSISPKLSVCYNSSSGDGLFGHGTDLSGLSMISRVPADMIHDGTPGVVDVNSARFALDGTRLIETDRNSEYITYATEVNNYARIRAYGEENSPSSFVMETKDGLTYTYKPNNELVLGASSALYWMLTKVMDTNGNYFTVTYNGSSIYNEIYPTRIQYTGNEKYSLDPNISIDLSYYEYNKHQLAQYVSGMPVLRKHVVRNIRIKINSNLLREYDFDYNNGNGFSDDDNRCYLTKITERASDGTIINPTLFDWSEEEKTPKDITKYSQADFNKANITIGDFNGDGKSDAFLTPQDRKAGWNGFRLFLSDGDSLCLSYSSENSNIGNLLSVEQVQSADFNGDGFDDIIIVLKPKIEQKYITYLYLSKGTNENGFFESPD